MKKLLAVAFAICLALATSANAEVVSIRVCSDKTLAASTTTDCTDNGPGSAGYQDITKFKFFSYQIYCAELTDNSMDIDVDWIGGSYGQSAYMAVPILSTGSAMTQLKTNYTTEDAWSALASIQPPVSPVGTIRLTENNNDDDIVCTVILNMGN